MKVLNEIAHKCEQKYVRTNRIPVQVRVPRQKYNSLVEELKGCMRLPEMEKVYGQLPDGSYGWRRETAFEYQARINRPPVTLTLTLATGTLNVCPHDSTEIEVLLESTN